MRVKTVVIVENIKQQVTDDGHSETVTMSVVDKDKSPSLGHDNLYLNAIPSGYVRLDLESPLVQGELKIGKAYWVELTPYKPASK